MNQEELQTLIYKVQGWRDRAEADYEKDAINKRFFEGQMIAYAKVVETLKKAQVES